MDKVEGYTSKLKIEIKTKLWQSYLFIVEGSEDHLTTVKQKLRNTFQLSQQVEYYAAMEIGETKRHIEEKYFAKNIFDVKGDFLI